MSTYNGWTNYATWNVALWLGNEDDSFITEQTREFYANAKEPEDYNTREQETAYRLAEWMKSYIEELNPLADDASMFSDLLQSALDDVNWNEIAEHYIDDLDKTEFEDEDEDEDEE